MAIEQRSIGVVQIPVEQRLTSLPDAHHRTQDAFVEEASHGIVVFVPQTVENTQTNETDLVLPPFPQSADVFQPTPTSERKPLLSEEAIRFARETEPNKTAAAHALGVGLHTLEKYFTEFGIEPYTKSESLANFYRDEEKKAATMQKVQSPDSRAKRSRSVAEAHKAGKIRMSPEKVAIREREKQQKKDALHAYILQGMTDIQIAEEMQVNHRTVSRWRSDFGFEAMPISPVANPNQERRTLIEAFRTTRYFTMLTPEQQTYCARRFPEDGSTPASLSEIGSTRQAALMREQRIANRIRKICDEFGITAIDLVSSHKENPHG